MMNGWRPLFLTAALTLTVSVSAGSAQTLIVTNAPAGSTVELVLNTATVGSATADSAGVATVAARQPATAAKTEMDAYIFVDSCDTLRRVVVVDRNVLPQPPAPGCERAQIAGLFLVRRVSTLVVNVAGPNPTVLLRQGSFRLRPPGPTRTWGPPAGLVLSGGAGLSTVSNAVDQACGDLTDCSGDKSGAAYSLAVAYWFSKYVAVEAAYLEPAEVTASGSGTNFRFNSFLDAHVGSLVGKAGVPAGRVRIYGQGGLTYHQAIFNTSQTIQEVTVTINDVATTIPGGTQSYKLKTAGWGWMFGGGTEVWLKSSFGIYGEAGRAALRGKAREGGDGEMNAAAMYVVLGARVRLFGF